MKITPKPKLKNVAFRLPEDVREKALTLASSSGVKESEVYRSIVVDFFSLNCQHKVDKTETYSENSNSTG